MWLSVMVALVTVSLVWAAHGTLADAQEMHETRTIGLLVPYTGPASTLAGPIDGAINYALDRFNKNLHEQGAGWRLAVEARDTMSDPAESLRLIEELDGIGIKAVIGPATSQSVREIKSYIDANDMVAISYSSGASDLSIPGDRIFRTISDTQTQSVAFYRQLSDDGISEVITIFLDDSIGRSVNHTTYEAVNADVADGISMRGSIAYTVGMVDPSTVAGDLTDLLAGVPAADLSTVAVVIFDYSDNIISVVEEIARSQIYGISDTRWYGPDHHMAGLAANPITSSFLTETSYKAFVLSHVENDLNMRIDSVVSGANLYSYTAYDALFILGGAIDRIGSATDAGAIAAAIPEVARLGHGPDLYTHVENPLIPVPDSLRTYSAAMGSSIELNEAGDLAQADYQIYSMLDGAFEITHRYDSATDSIQEFTAPEERKVGVLVSETGSLASELGISASKATSLAAYNYNLELASTGADWRLEIVREDDGTSPARTLENVRAFHADGIRAMVGPVTSGSVSEIIDFVNDNEMVTISYASSSPVLALSDNVFRMRADDSQTIRAYVSLLKHDGISELVIIHRNDPWGNALNDNILDSVGQIDDITALSSISYPASGSDQDYSGVIDTLVSQLHGVDRSSIAVVLYGFAETNRILDMAESHPDLQDGRWYAYFYSPSPQYPPELIPWMENVRYTGVITHTIRNDVNQHIDANVPGANLYAHHAYDALYALADAIDVTGTASDAALLSAVIPMTAEGLSPTATGFPVTLNAAGDQMSVDYDVYEARDGAFVLRAFYDSSEDRLRVFDAPSSNTSACR